MFIKNITGKKKIGLIVLGAVIVIALLWWLISAIIVKPASEYSDALELYEMGNYDSAILKLDALDGYKDSEDLIKEIRYANANYLYENGEYAEAAALYDLLGDYEDSASKKNEARIANAESLYSELNYDKAAVNYKLAGDDEKANAIMYEKGEYIYSLGKHDEAINIFDTLGDYSDASERSKAVRYDKANILFANGEHELAKAEYQILGDYSESESQYIYCLFFLNSDYSVTDNGEYILNSYEGTEESVVIPEGVIELGRNCFSGNTTMKEVSLPSTLKTIGNTAFARTSSLVSVTIPGSVTKVGNMTFIGSTALEEVIFEDGVGTIGTTLFQNCKALKRVVIPASVTEIGINMFIQASSDLVVEVVRGSYAHTYVANAGVAFEAK